MTGRCPGHGQKLLKRRLRLDIERYTFIYRVVNKWNSLSERCVTCTNVNFLKKFQSNCIGSNSTWLDSTRHVRLCRASRASWDERVERDESCSSNMADDERSCTSL